MKIKFLIPVLFILAGMIASCKKENTSVGQMGFVKAIECDFDVAVAGNILLNDNSLIVVCRAIDRDVPGYMYKIDNKGNLVWKKRLPSLNLVLWQAYDLPGNGFATIGYEDRLAPLFEICLFDDDGDFLSSRQIPVNDPFGQAGNLYTLQMLKLSNGNIVFMGRFNNSYLITITNSSFDTLAQNIIPPPAGRDGFLRAVFVKWPIRPLLFQLLQAPQVSAIGMFCC